MRKLKYILPKKSGRSRGKVTVRHQGGRHKRFQRVLSFIRNKKEIWAVVESIEYDPNRNADCALICYEDGRRDYIIAPVGLKVGAKIISSDSASISAGNSLPMSAIPVGTLIHNIEINPGKGAQMVKGAGSVAVLHGKEDKYVLVKLPSGEIRRFFPNCRATVGQVGKGELRSVRLGKAGKKRWLGIRPTVRGTAQNPRSHPHGGGEGRSGIGLKHPKTPWGKSAVGITRKKNRYSNKLIVQRRRKGPHVG